jgi:(p)ppGpp synthase/HD superfamily hydrolase
MKTDIKSKALEFASKAHSGQFRKYSKEPYVNHPIAVASIATNTFLDEMKEGACHTDVVEYSNTLFVVALLHDTVEDCANVTIQKIEDEFGIEIAQYVEKLTKVNGESYLQAILRANTTDVSRRVKIADLTHNISDLSNGPQRDKYQMALHILQHHKVD